MTEGYIKLYRNLLENPVTHEPEMAWLWCVLLLSTNHKPIKKIWNGESITIEAGQFITGRKVLSQKTGLSENKVYRYLNYFEKEQQIKQQKNNKFTIVTILNWHKYQGNGTTDKQQDEQQIDNKSTTNRQQIDTNKNVKNVKNDNKDLKPLATDVKKTSAAQITFNRDTLQFEGITEKDIDLWSEAYPAVALDVEMKAMIDWIINNGRKGYKSNWRRFMSNWYKRCQDRGGSK